MIEVRRYLREANRSPADDWLVAMRDKVAQAAVRVRIRRMESGNFGDCKPVGEGVLEVRVDVGAGYRLYCGRRGATLVILLCGGDKRGQRADIERAKVYWADWKQRNK